MAKKKTKKRRGTPPGVDPNQARRERLEARRRAKAEQMERRRKAERREKLIRRAVMLLIVVGLVWFIFLRTQRPGEIDGHELELLSESIQGQQHVTGTVQYDSTPPVSGSHAASPVPLCGTYGDQIPNEQFVHTLEHGTIGILYDPEKVKVSDVRRIEEIVAGYDSHVLSMPYSTMETPIAVTSWGEMMRLDSLDAGAVREYIDTFRQKGPEKIDCPMDADDEFQPEPAPTQSPDASPSPDQTPGSDKN
ncbi:MAG: DUF3105 domain-containing protein [Actinomycetota bacterium]|nr:DUF3105 domain-containing protein [Actinomycetota bacterium]